MQISEAERADFRRHVAPFLEATVFELAMLRDPGAREAASGTLLAPALLDVPDDLVSEALDVVAAAPQGPALLAGMAVAAPTRIAAGARVALEGIEDAPPPLGALRVKEAWEMDAGEPVTGLYALCTREGERGAQLFSFVVEEVVSGGAIKDGFVTGMREGTRLVKAMRTQLPEEVELRKLDPSEAKERIVTAATQGAQTGFAPTPDGLAAATIFLRASGVEDADAVVEKLELGEPLADRIDELDEEAFGAVEELSAIAEGWLAGRGSPRERVELGRYAAGLMGDFRVMSGAPDLTSWTADELDEFLFEWLPSEDPLDDDDVESFPSAVADVLEFFGATGRLAEGEAGKLAARATSHSQRFAEAMAEPRRAGPAQALVDAMTTEGVEIGDPDALAAWLEDFNSRPFEERDRILGPAPFAASDEPAPPRKEPKETARGAQRQAPRRRNRGS